MEFHFRAAAGRPQTHSSSSSKIVCLSEQALPAYPRFSPTQNPELTPREVVQRQIENEGTKTNKTGVGAEVRRELIAVIEEEVAMRGMSLEERLAMRLNSKLSMLFTNESDTRLPVPGVQPQLPRLQTPEAPAVVKPAVKDNKDQLNVLAKPDSNLWGARSVAAPPARDSIPFACLFKKPKDEWSCALCQVSATSEKSFKEHLRCKKHLIEEAELRNQKMAKNHVVAAPWPEKIGRSKKCEFGSKICEIGANSALVMETHKKGKKHLIKEAGQRNQKMAKNHVVAAPWPEKIGRSKKCEFGSKICEIGANSALVMETHKKGKKHLIKEAGQRNQKMAKNHVVAAPSPEKIGMRKKLEFWCEICEIGANSAVVMEIHKKGKKHSARLQEPLQNDKAIPSITAMEVSDDGEESKKNLARVSEERDKKQQKLQWSRKQQRNDAIEEKTAENVVEDVYEPRLPPDVNDQV